jgi:hyaluronoglucosaminidase
MKSLAILILILSIEMNISASPILLRGIVEGFYGTPWNFDIRADLIRFCGEYNLNAYIYAPKDDPYHRDKWREPYPEDKISELKGLVDISLENNVHFIFAVSPGLDLNYEGEKGEQDLQSMINKLDMMYNIGMRDFAIFFDDLEGEQSGKNHATFLNRLQDALDKKYEDIYPLITVPTQYTRHWMIDDEGNIKQYTQEFTTLLNTKIVVLYTGDDVVCDGITEESYQAAKDIYKRDLGIWWNYPVNDYYLVDGNRNIKLALGPIEKLPKAKANSIFYNPMEQPLLSKLSMATGAEYALDTENYDSVASWNRIIEKQFGELAPAMKVFASHSQHMQNSWAKCGPPDAPEFYATGHQAILDTKDGKTVDFTDLDNYINEMENSANILLEKLPNDILNECKVMLEQFKRITNADRVATQCLKNNQLDPELKTLRQEIKEHESTAMISEFSALLYIDEVIQLYES